MTEVDLLDPLCLGCGATDTECLELGGCCTRCDHRADEWDDPDDDWPDDDWDDQPPSSFTCPRCGTISHHPDDLAHGYCGRCHAFTGPDTACGEDHGRIVQPD